MGLFFNRFFDPIEAEPGSDIASLPFSTNKRFEPGFYSFPGGTKVRLDKSNGLIDQDKFKELG